MAGPTPSADMPAAPLRTGRLSFSVQPAVNAALWQNHVPDDGDAQAPGITAPLKVRSTNSRTSGAR